MRIIRFFEYCYKKDKLLMCLASIVFALKGLFSRAVSDMHDFISETLSEDGQKKLILSKDGELYIAKSSKRSDCFYIDALYADGGVRIYLEPRILEEIKKMIEFVCQGSDDGSVEITLESNEENGLESKLITNYDSNKISSFVVLSKTRFLHYRAADELCALCLNFD